MRDMLVAGMELIGPGTLVDPLSHIDTLSQVCPHTCWLPVTMVTRVPTRGDLVHFTGPEVATTYKEADLRYLHQQERD